MRARIPKRPRAPQWKIFDAQGLYMGSLHDPTDAAAVIANYADGSQVRFGRDIEDTVWTEGVDGQAGDSFDGTVDLMFFRLDEIRAKRKKAAAEHSAAMRRSMS